ncbi:Transposon Tf2-9 polyprotein [Cucumispora dikerogammari]|nr:Transposon Tf2-9 polyprotein [Cucumispora dikerogammari]
MSIFLEKNKVKRLTSRPRHPQTNGQVERSNQTLMRWIHRRLLTEKENEINYCWAKYLEDVKYTYNISVHGGKKPSPFMMFLKNPGFNTIMIRRQSSKHTRY